MRFLFLYILFFLPYITYAELLFECEVLECEIPQSQSINSVLNLRTSVQIL